MKYLPLLAAPALACAAVFAPAAALPPQSAPAAPAPAAGQPSPETVAAFNSIAQRVRLKLIAANGAKPDLAEELKQLEALAAQVKATSPAEAAEILFARAMLFMEVLDQPDAAIQAVKQIQADLPGTVAAREAPKIIAAMEKMAAGKRIQAELAVGKIFPAFAVQDLAGQPLSIAQYTGPGKVLLVDFWAVWCGPCIAELPNVLAAYKKYHEKGFNIIGISLDEDKPRLEAFLKQQGMTWPQFNDGRRWDNALAVKYGINAIPATFLLDGEGRIIGKNLRGAELEKAVAAALEKK